MEKKEGKAAIHGSIFRDDEGDFELLQSREEEDEPVNRDSVKSDASRQDSRKSLRRTLTMQTFIDVEENRGSNATFLHGLIGKKITVFFLLACMVLNSYLTEIINLVSTISPIVQQPAEIVLGESISVSAYLVYEIDFINL